VNKVSGTAWPAEETIADRLGITARTVAVLASQATIWHSLATIRDAIQQTNAIILAACGSDERPCQVAAHAGRSSLVRS
jgi:hypothetical protein